MRSSQECRDVKSENYWLMHGDCLERMRDIEAESVDLILTDPPYGTTACKWDTIIPFDLMWAELKRIIKPRGAIVLFGSQPFTSTLICSNISMFKYEWIWEKAVGSNFATLKYQPMKEHENVIVFSNGVHNYYPIKQPRKGSGAARLNYGHGGSVTGEANGSQVFSGWEVGKYDKEMRNPSSVQFFNNREKSRGLHPTQKPIALLEYLVQTYTLEGQTVLDFTVGSGSTVIASINTGRKSIGIERDDHYFDVACNRIANHEVI